MTKEDLKQVLRIHAIDTNGSTGDGPGVRVLVFVQGCVRHCPGCHNRTTWAVDGGKKMTVAEIVKRLTASACRRVTISGGEPLLQPDGVAALLRVLKAKGFTDLCLYTGFSEDEVSSAIRENLTYLKTGAFRQEEKTSLKPFVGSVNQIFRRVA